MATLHTLSLSLAFMLFLSISSLKAEQATNGTFLFVFGDSYYDTGNTNYLLTAPIRANPPYGETFFKMHAGRFSNGRLIPDFIAELASLPFPSPNLQTRGEGLTTSTYGANFACASAGALIETFAGTTISLPVQVENYKKMAVEMTQRIGPERANMTLSNAVYLINIGLNDIIFALNTFTVIDVQYLTRVIRNITMAIREIYALGGRKFAINNVGPLGCFPTIKTVAPTSSGRCVQQASQLAMLLNQLLSQALPGLPTELKDIKYGLFDLYNNLGTIISNSTNYGFTENETACCGSGRFRGIFSCGQIPGSVRLYQLCDNPDEYVFWDSIHPTEKTYKQLAAKIWAGSPPDIGPYNVKTLFQST